jgi:ArsR family transcriptional regulator
MSSTLNSLRILADPTRARLLHLLETGELTVAEIQSVLGMGQSRISTHLSQLKRAGLVQDRRVGKNSFYSWAAHGVIPQPELKRLLQLVIEEIFPLTTEVGTTEEFIRRSKMDADGWISFFW